jgi:hypothetical protein
VSFKFADKDNIIIPVPGVKLPNNSFNITDLTTHIRSLDDSALVQDMEAMLHMSNYKPSSKAKPFLERLVKILQSYLQAKGQVWQDQ